MRKGRAERPPPATEPGDTRVQEERLPAPLPGLTASIACVAILLLILLSYGAGFLLLAYLRP